MLEFLQGTIYNTERQIKNLDTEINNISTTIDNVTSSVKGLADNALANVAAKIATIKKEYEDLIKQLQYQASAKWYHDFDYNGRHYHYESAAEDYNDAALEIRAAIERDLKIFKGDVFGGLKHYASGTNSATGGLSLVGERGAELRVLNPGDGILKNQIVRGLTSLGTNPAQFIADAGKKLLSSLFGNSIKPSFSAIGAGNNQPISIVNHIQGDVNPSTLKALVAAQKKIVQESVRAVQKQSLSLRPQNSI